MAYYSWENKRRDRLEQGHKENIEFLDLTDRENKEFRVSSIRNQTATAREKLLTRTPSVPHVMYYLPRYLHVTPIHVHLDVVLRNQNN